MNQCPNCGSTNYQVAQLDGKTLCGICFKVYPIAVEVVQK